MSDHLRPFVEHLYSIQAAYLATHADIHVHSQCFCCKLKMPATFWCLDCYCQPPWCHDCIAASHLYEPYHQIEEWNGLYFWQILLCEIGITLYLGHCSEHCPNRNEKTPGWQFTICHTNGVHQLLLFSCCCKDAGEEWQQLLNEGFFPGTLTYPKTCFTR